MDTEKEISPWVWGDEKKERPEILQGKIEMLEILIEDSRNFMFFDHENYYGWLKEDLEEKLIELKKKQDLDEPNKCGDDGN